MRKSGLHHAAGLCKIIAGISDCSWDWRMLRRVGEQARQSELSAHARRKNLRRAFRADQHYREGMQIKGRIWVVDDILTTGTTLHCACKALRTLNRPVHAFSLARAMREENG
jgi:predicted amidophosphoribosyltransferase